MGISNYKVEFCDNGRYDLFLSLNYAFYHLYIIKTGWEDPLEEDMATNSNILAWRIPMD